MPSGQHQLLLARQKWVYWIPENFIMGTVTVFYRFRSSQLLKMRLSGHVTLSGENRDAHRIQSENKEENDRLRRYRNRRKGNIKSAFEVGNHLEIGNHLVQNSV
jgi:hypothetical protein